MVMAVNRSADRGMELNMPDYAGVDPPDRPHSYL
jgi:hypothetical protein